MQLLLLLLLLVFQLRFSKIFHCACVCVCVCVCEWDTTSLIDCAADLKGQRTAGEVTNKSVGLCFFYFFI